MHTDTLIHFGGSVKVLSTKGDLVTIGGPGVVFDDPDDPVKDLTGDYFTSESYFGALKGNGVDCAFHHGFPIEGKTSFAKALSEYFFPPVKAEMDEAAIVASVILDKRKEYEAFAFEQAEKGLLSWSSGAVGHLVKRMDDGWLKCWPIGEWSLTPTPAEPRTTAIPIKSLLTRPATKAESITARLDRIYRAFYDKVDGRGYVLEIFEDHVVAEISSSYYRIGFDIDESSVTFADAPAWEKVERVVEYVAAKALHEHYRTTKSAHTPGTTGANLDDLFQTLRMQNLNLKAHTLLGG